MNDRLQTFLTLENLTAAQLADKMGIQRSGLSHILSGRNKPGYDFLVKFINKFPKINPEWLLTGKGKVYKDSSPISDDTISSSSPSQKIEEPFLSLPNNDQISSTVKKQSEHSPNRDGNEQTLFSQDNNDTSESDTHVSNNEKIIEDFEEKQPYKNSIFDSNPHNIQEKRNVKKVLILYDDNSFQELYPETK